MSVKAIQMLNPNLTTGEMVKFNRGECEGLVGVITQPISPEQTGHVLLLKDGYLRGIDASRDDLVLADKSDQGFAQLAYNLIKLGSHVIEERLLEGYT